MAFISSPSDKILYQWEIEEFNIENCYYFSPEFSPSGNDSMKWRLKIEKLSSSDGTFMSVYLLLVQSEQDSVSARCKFFILNAKNEAQNVKKSDGIDVIYRAKSLGFRNFIKYEDLFDSKNGFLPNNTLTVHCKMLIYDKFLPTCAYVKTTTNIDLVNHGNEVLDKLGGILNTGLLSDFTFLVGDKTIRVHKCILAAQSPVFQAMFENDMKENATNSAEITDSEYEPLLELMRYIYTGNSPNLKDMAKELFVQADKYFLEGLKEHCRVFLYSRLTVDSAAELLLWSYENEVDDMKQNILDLFLDNSRDITKTPGFEMLLQEKEIIADLINYKKKRNENPTEKIITFRSTT